MDLNQTLVISPTGQNTELHLTAKHSVLWEIYLNEGLNRFKECQNPLCVCMYVCVLLGIESRASHI